MRAALIFACACSATTTMPADIDATTTSGDGSIGDAPTSATNYVLVAIVGDSIGAGYNAANNNAPGGSGYARRVYDDVRAKTPNAAFKDTAESGATSDEAKAKVHATNWPTANGPVLVLINVGGNDFNDSIQTMISTSATATAAMRLRANLADIVGHLRTKYSNATFAIDTIHDPTDGMGTIPPQFDDGFCGTIQNPLFTPALRQTVLVNLATMNTAIRDEATAQQATLVDMHGAFMGHGMNGGNVRWLSNDCAHPTSDGHGHLRDAVWDALP